MAASSQPFAPVFYLTALLIPIGTLIRIQQAGLQGLHLTAWGQIPEFIIQPFVLLILVFIFFYEVKQSLIASQVMILNIIAGALALLMANQLLKRSLPFETFSTSPDLDSRRWISSLVPLMLVGTVYILNDQLATVLLGLLSNTSQLAIFAAADKWAGLAIFMLVALNPVLAPVFARLHANNDKKHLQWIVTISSQITALFALIALVSFMIVPQLFLSTFGDDFYDARTPLIILGIGQFINASTGSVGVLLSMTGHERSVVTGAGLGALVNLSVGILLIPYLDAVGAAIGASAGMIATNVLLSIVVLRTLRIFPTALGPLFTRRSIFP